MYIHVPFCRSKCLYCDFVSYTDFSPMEDYFHALWKEIELWAKLLPNVRVETIYVGGGSPSDVPFEFLKETLKRVRSYFRHDKGYEFTVEINPTCGFVEELETLSVNRISIGLQAADDEVLRRVRRRHSLNDFLETFERAKSFSRVNVDFIVGLPGESDETIENDVRLVQELRPDHVSIYLLEDHDGKLETPPVEMIELRYERFIQAIESMGYQRYEISNFALDGKFCRHNLKYWKNENYLGLGVAAGGHLNRLRYVNCSRLDEYISRVMNGEFAFDYVSKNDEIQELKETLFMGLRLREGVSLERLKSLWPRFDPFALFSDLLGEFMEIRDGTIRLTERGFDLSARVLADVVDRIDRIPLMAVGR